MNRDIFGNIKPPPGSEFATGPNPLGALLSTIINIFLLVSGIVALIYLLWGAFSWITSGGDKEKLLKAQGMIRNAIIGLIIVFAALVVFNVIVGTVLGGRIIQITPSGFQFNLPQIGR
ncbi:hypothetical protein HYT33_03485 [Candidatus Roizmanbacteria bacterium]|nr:hypothetical protein [Candidatus Roizmanbacteria bacterium]